VQREWQMCSFAGAWSDPEFVQQAAAQIPLSHTCVILDKFSEGAAREWYIWRTIENGWSRNVLVHQIENRVIEREGGRRAVFVPG